MTVTVEQLPQARPGASPAPPSAPSSAPAAPSAGSRLAQLLIRCEERFIVPVVCSPRAPAWRAAHAGLSLPLRLAGRLRWYGGSAEGRPVRIACVGPAKRFAPVLRRVLESLRPLHGDAWRSAWNVDSMARLPADLVAVEIHRWLAPRFRAAGWILVPDNVRWRGDLASVPPERPSNSLRYDLRKIRRMGYELEVAGSPEDWREFYEEMVLPLAHDRFGTDAWVASPGLLRDFRRAGRLFFVLRDGRRVAAGCGIGAGKVFWLPLIGVRGGDPALMAEGASTAACALPLAWARDNGFEILDWGRTSPFVNDGVQKFNRKWGLTPVPDPLAHVTALRVNPRSSALRAAFAREPVLTLDTHGLREYAG